MILWVIIAIVFVGYVLIFLWQLENEGIAINKAGSLRMRTYHMVALLNRENSDIELKKIQTDFQNIIQNLKKTPRRSLMLLDTKEIDHQIQAIDKEWQNQIQPLINRYIDHRAGPIISEQDLKRIDQFVAHIDVFVSLIEAQNTQRIDWIRFIQSFFVGMIIICAFAGIYLLYCLVIKPLESIKKGLHELSQGNLSKRLPVTVQDEFGVVAAGFNAMADNLQDLYTNLEEKVAEKTLDLKEKNNELSALYEMTSFFHETHTLEMISSTFLKKAIELSKADAGSIRLLDEIHQRINFIHSQSLPDKLIQSNLCTSISGCRCGYLVNCMIQSKQPSELIDSKQESLLACAQAGFSQFSIFEICCNNKVLGIVTLFFKNPEKSTSPYQHLMKTLSGQLAIAIENQQLAIKDKQLAIMEERNHIAQGLHDSIAQALSFLNLQAQMLQSAIKNNNIAQAHINMDFIRKGIQESYEDVRELLLNFRTPIHKNNFNDTIQALLNRFQIETKREVQLNSEIPDPFLTTIQKTQIIFILQEILSNIRKHAQCVSVSVTFEDDHDFKMIVKDDGVGFNVTDIEAKKNRHVGLSIMSERAAQISASIEIHSFLGKGTTVILTIPKTQRETWHQ